MKNNRTFLEKLLDGAEVEWKPLKDILIRTKGTKITAAEMKVLHKDNAPLKIFAGGKTFALVNFEDVPEKDINKNPSIIVKSRGIIEFEYYDKPFSHKNEMWSYYSNDKNINIKYIYYVLKNQEPYFQNLGSKMQMPQIATPDTDKYLVPIPSLPVQTEIVKILDALTALTGELTSELTSELILRRKQYEYYREKLLSHHNDSENSSQQKVDKDKLFSTSNIQWLHLNEIYKFQYGIGNKIPTIGGEYPVYGSNGIVGSHNEYNSEDAPVIGHIGAYAGIVNWAEGKHFVTYNGIICNKINDNVNSRYAYYLLLSQNFIDKANKASQPFISYDILNKCIVPVPPIEEQERIVSILNKFEALTNSITEGLPLAIEQSQKRYEYYRELLLNFS